MSTYVLYIIVLLFVAAFSYFILRNVKLTYIVIICGIIILKTFVDINSLPDLENYYSGYLEICKLDFLRVPFGRIYTLKCPEIGFRYILKIAGCLGSFRYALLFIAVIFAISRINITRLYSPYIYLSILIFVCGMMQSNFVLRQHLAISLTLFSYPYIINRNFKGFIILEILAFFCHQTALIFLPIYFLYGVRNSKLLWGFYILLTIVLLGFFNLIINKFAIGLVGYESYFNSYKSNLTGLLLSIFYLGTFLLFLRKDAMKDGINRLILSMLLTMFCIYLTGFTFTGINRLLMYFSSCLFICIPLILNSIMENIVRYIIALAYLVIIIYSSFISSNVQMYIDNFKFGF